jgi:hypothetical protein
LWYPSLALPVPFECKEHKFFERWEKIIVRKTDYDATKCGIVAMQGIGFQTVEEVHHHFDRILGIIFECDTGVLSLLVFRSVDLPESMCLWEATLNVTPNKARKTSHWAPTTAL